MSNKNFAKYKLLLFPLLIINAILLILILSPVINYLYAALEVKPEVRKSDSIILLSSGVHTEKIHDGNNYQRMIHAYRLYKDGFADKIIICGGVVIKEMPSFAEIMKNFLRMETNAVH